MQFGACEPRVTIVVPFYNHIAGLPALLDSILRQSLKSLEVIIVDDGSREDCAGVVEAYRDKGLAVFLARHSENRGAKEARLTGIELAGSRIIGFADADDTLYGDTALETHMRMMEESGADILQFAALFHDCATGVESVPEWHGSLGDELEGGDIFGQWLEKWGRGGTMWNKLYSGALCRKILETCRPGRVRWACEDFYLSAMLMFHARRYRSSEIIGYRYNDDFAASSAQQGAGRMADLIHILDEMVPYLKREGCEQKQITRFVEIALRLLRVNFEAGCDGLYVSGLPMPEPMFISRNGYVDAAILTRCFHFLVHMERRSGNIRLSRAGLSDTHGAD